MPEDESRHDLRESGPGGALQEGGRAPDAGGDAEEGAETEDPEFAAPEFVELSPAEAAREVVLCGQTMRRIEWMIVVAGVVCAAALLRPLGWAVAAGMLLGTLLGWINFRWLAASVNGIGERIVQAGSRERGRAIVARGLGRLILIALFAYGIFEWSVRALIGYLAGLAMPVAAMLCEAAYEIVVSIRRPS